MRKLLTALSAAALVGCGDKAPAPAPAPAPAAAAATTPPVVSITATDYAFTMPDTIPGGWLSVKVTNQGKELHHVQLVRFEQGKTLTDLAKWTSPALPEWVVMTGGPTGTPPGASNEALVHLAPGSYAALCFIPGPDHKPHIMKGMMKAITVVPATSAAAPGEADIDVTLTDYDFAFSKPLTAGKHLLKIETSASQPHEMVIVKLAPGKTAGDVVAWVDKQNGPPPIEGVVGSSSVSKGEVNLVPVDLAPGDYGLICFAPDAKDGAPHAVHGMMKQIKIT